MAVRTGTRISVMEKIRRFIEWIWSLVVYLLEFVEKIWRWWKNKPPSQRSEG
jgi:hypothetical protein